MAREGEGVNEPEIDKLFGFLGGCEVVDVNQQWVVRDDLNRVLVLPASSE